MALAPVCIDRRSRPRRSAPLDRHPDDPLIRASTGSPGPLSGNAPRRHRGQSIAAHTISGGHHRNPGRRDEPVVTARHEARVDVETVSFRTHDRRRSTRRTPGRPSPRRPARRRPPRRTSAAQEARPRDRPGAPRRRARHRPAAAPARRPARRSAAARGVAADAASPRRPAHSTAWASRPAA